MARVMVTGGAGFIGCHVIKELIPLGHEIALYDSFLHYTYPLELSHIYNVQHRLRDVPGSVEVIRGNTQDMGHLSRTVREFQPTHIIHLAAMPLAKLAMRQPEEALSAIIHGTMNLLQAARELTEFERFVYISSSMVYGDFQRVPADEDHPTNPKELYGALKLSGEIITRAYSRLYGIEHAIVRPSAVYGPTDNNRRVLSVFLDNALQGKPLELRGEQTMLDFTYVTDVASGMVAATFHPGGGDNTFNITRGEGRTLLQAAELVAKLVPGTRIEILEAERSIPTRGTLDISRARSLIDYDPKVDLKQGLERYLAFLKDQGAEQREHTP